MTEERRMNGVEFLNQIPQADAKVKKMRARVESLEALATDIARHMNGPIGHGQADADKIGTLAAEICDAKQELAEAEEAAGEIRERIGRMICQIEDERITKIMMKRFLHGMKWKEIAADLRYSEQWIYTLRVRGITEIEMLLSDGRE